MPKEAVMERTRVIKRFTVIIMAKPRVMIKQSKITAKLMDTIKQNITKAMRRAMVKQNKIMAKPKDITKQSKITTRLMDITKPITVMVIQKVTIKEIMGTIMPAITSKVKNKSEKCTREGAFFLFSKARTVPLLLYFHSYRWRVFHGMVNIIQQLIM